jgi:deoxyhypusine synthase
MVEQTDKDKALKSLSSAVYVTSQAINDAVQVRGYDFNKGLDYNEVFKTYVHTGFQATSLGQAIEEVNKMIAFRLSDDPIAEDEDD